MLFRLYLVPMAALFMLLALFLITRVVGLDPTQKSGLYTVDLVGALVRMMFMIAVAIVPWFLAKYLAIAPVAALKTAIAKTTEMADHSGANAWLEAGASGVSALNASNAAKHKEEREKIESGEKGEHEALGSGEGDEDVAGGEDSGTEDGEGGASLLAGAAGVADTLALGAGGDDESDEASGEGDELGGENLALANPLDDEAEDGSGDALIEGEASGDALGSGEDDTEALGSGEDDTEALGGDDDQALGAGDDAEDSDQPETTETDEDSVAALGSGEGIEEGEEGDVSPLTPEEQAQLDFFDNARRLANGQPPLTGGTPADPVAQARDDIVMQEVNDYVDDVARIGRGEAPKREPAPLSAEEDARQRKAFFEDRRRMAQGQLPQMSPEEFRDAHVRILNQNRMAAAASNADAVTGSQAPTGSPAKGSKVASPEEHWSGAKPGPKAASMLALIPGHDSTGRQPVSAANRGNRPRFMDRFGTKTRKAIRAAAIVTDFDSIRSDLVGTSERPGSLRHQGRIIRSAGLLSTITGTAFVERVSSAELNMARNTVKAYNDPATRQRWLAGDAKSQFQEAEAQIKTLRAAAAQNPEDLEVQMRLMEAQSNRSALLAAAKPDKAFAAQYAQAEQMVAEAKELGGAGTNFGRAMDTKTAAFQADVAAYQKGGRAELSDEMMDPRRWAVRLAANSQTGARMARDRVVATDKRWSGRQQSAIAAKAQLEADVASLAMARADAESAATSRGALVNNIAGHLDAGQSGSYAALAAAADDPTRFAEQLGKERAAAAARLAAAQKPYQEIDSAMTHLLVGGRPPEQALKMHQEQAERIRAEEAAADHEVTTLMAALNSGKALPESTQSNYAAQLELAQQRREAAAAQASQHEELVGRIATRIPTYRELERQRAASLKERANTGAADKALMAALDGLAAKAADPAARPALREAIRASQHAGASAAGSSAHAYGARMESVVKSLAVANAANDAAARAEAEKARAALLSSARAELGNAGATRLDEAVREGVARETELLRQQAAASSSYEKTATLRAAPPIFSVLHPRKTVADSVARHVGSPNESAVYARHRAGAQARLESLQAEAVILEETAARNARNKREDPHVTEALAAQHAAMAREQAILEGVNTHDHLSALAADQRRAERLKYREKLHAETLEQHGALKRQLERARSAEIIWNQAQEAAIHGKVDPEAVERRRASYEQEARLAAIESEKLRRMEADQQDFLSQSD
jgi:hypothetical protein